MLNPFASAAREDVMCTVRVVNTFENLAAHVELDDGVTVFSELHADSSRQLTKVTTDNFFTVMYVNRPLLFERHLGGRRKPIAVLVNKNDCKSVLAFFDSRDIC